MNTTKISTEKKDVQSYVYRIERSYSNLLRYREEMNSYTNEPRTYDWYKTKAIIKDTIVLILQGHMDTLALLWTKKNNTSYMFSLAQQQLTAAEGVEQKITDYIAMNQAMA